MLKHSYYPCSSIFLSNSLTRSASASPKQLVLVISTTNIHVNRMARRFKGTGKYREGRQWNDWQKVWRGMICGTSFHGLSFDVYSLKIEIYWYFKQLSGCADFLRSIIWQCLSGLTQPSCPGWSLLMTARFMVMPLRQSNNPPNDKSKPTEVEVTLRPTISQQSVLVSGAHLGPVTNFSFS
jgi:hypothetical protein